MFVGLRACPLLRSLAAKPAAFAASVAASEGGAAVLGARCPFLASAPAAAVRHASGMPPRKGAETCPVAHHQSSTTPRADESGRVTIPRTEVRVAERSAESTAVETCPVAHHHKRPVVAPRAGGGGEGRKKEGGASFAYNEVLVSALDKLRAAGEYRVFRYMERQVGAHPRAVRHDEPHGNVEGNETTPVTIWCSNDYLGMGHSAEVLEAMGATLATVGAGAGGTRNIGGSSHLHAQLETELAALHNKERALLFSSCFVANDATLATLGRALPEPLFLSDSLNHASLIQGIRNSRADKVVFEHNSVSHLDELLSSAGDRPKVVVFESVYSMCGSIAPVREMLDLCKKHGALSVLDEVHAVGLYGDRGGGIAQALGPDVEAAVDVFTGTLGKAYGVVGGYIAGTETMIDFVRSHAPGFIFTTAIPPVVAGGALASVRSLAASSDRRTAMHTNAAALKAKLRAANLPLMESPSHIIPLLVGEAARCKRVADMLLAKHGIYIQPINYPTVPKKTERLRITVSPLHTPVQIDALVDALVDVWDACAVPWSYERIVQHEAYHTTPAIERTRRAVLPPEALELAA